MKQAIFICALVWVPLAHRIGHAWHVSHKPSESSALAIQPDGLTTLQSAADDCGLCLCHLVVMLQNPHRKFDREYSSAPFSSPEHQKPVKSSLIAKSRAPPN